MLFFWNVWAQPKLAISTPDNFKTADLLFLRVPCITYALVVRVSIALFPTEICFLPRFVSRPCFVRYLFPCKRIRTQRTRLLPVSVTVKLPWFCLLVACYMLRPCLARRVSATWFLHVIQHAVFFFLFNFRATIKNFVTKLSTYAPACTPLPSFLQSERARSNHAVYLHASRGNFSVRASVFFLRAVWLVHVCGD